ncbi:MAG: ABC transporter ATP-binding protein [Phycicoccus sp.]
MTDAACQADVPRSSAGHVAAAAAHSTAPTLAVRDLTYSYDGSLNALHDISFEVAPGSIVGLIGPNGSGKSTLVKNIVDLLESQAGSVTIAGRPHIDTTAKSAAIYLASNDYLPEFLTGREYYRLLARLYDIDIDHGHAAELFDEYSMGGRYDHLIADYSHGMRKKTQLVSALLLDRPLTIIDETLNGIDLDAVVRVEASLRDLRSRGSAIILCTHDFTLLENLADRVLLLDLGELVVDCSVADFVDTHATLSNAVRRQLDLQG